LLPEAAFMVLVFVFECNPRVKIKKGREKGIGTIDRRGIDRRRKNQHGHL
jgi:hypothetical protein